FHGRWVRYRSGRHDGIFLQQDDEILIDARLTRAFGMHDERTKAAEHLLHRHVRVIEVRSRLMQRELINKAPTRLDWLLAQAGRTVHAVGNFETMPVHRHRLWQMVVYDEADAIALRHLDSRPGRATVETPQIHGFVRRQLLLYGLDDDVEHFYSTVHCEMQIGNIGGLHSRRRRRTGLYLRCGKHAGA